MFFDKKEKASNDFPIRSSSPLQFIPIFRCIITTSINFADKTPSNRYTNDIADNVRTFSSLSASYSVVLGFIITYYNTYIA